MALVSMKMKAGQAEKMTSPKVEKPSYPYGLCLELERPQLKALGLLDLEAGQQVVLEARAFVKRVSTSDSVEGSPTGTVSLQITHLSVDEDDEDDEEESVDLDEQVARDRG